MLKEDHSPIKEVPDKQREVWYTDEQKKQPKPMTNADIDAALRRKREREEKK